MINPFNATICTLLLFEGFSAILVWPIILIFDIRALWRSVRTERQSARMSKIKNGGLIFDIRALWRSVKTERQSARMSKIKNGGLDQYDKV